MQYKDCNKKGEGRELIVDNKDQKRVLLQIFLIY